MAAITAKDVAALRKQSGAGMMDCKKALQENDGNVEKAADWLRKKGMARCVPLCSLGCRSIHRFMSSSFCPISLPRRRLIDSD